ncbi:MAG: insulinase family protein [Candidatus Gastranaerophilales bacterium]|nr:insulinase family protein [Candidatus Gastranaerophilales bacterium]
MSKVVQMKTLNYPYLNKPLEIYTTDKGHTIIFAHKDGGLVNISTWVKTGSIHENDKINGVSHFLEHLMFKGTTAHKAGEFDRTLESKGAIINAATWKDYTFYYVTIPNGINDENVELSLKLHADMMVDPVIPDYEMGSPFDPKNPQVADKRERYVVIEEIGMRNDQPWTKVYNTANDNMYTDHPYKRDVIGTKEIIAQISRDEVMKYYRTWYTPENMTTIVVGDFNHEKVLDMILTEFKFKDKIEAEPVNLPLVAKLNASKIIENKGQIDTGFMIFGFHGAKASDNKGTILLEVLSMILGEGLSSRLYQNLIENSTKSIFNAVDSGQYQFKDGNVFMINANFDPNFKDEAVEKIKENIVEMQNNLVSEEELLKAKKKLKVKFAESAETVSEIGESIGYYMTVCDGLDGCANYIKDLESITREDVLNAAKKYLDLNSFVLSILMPET